MYGLRCGSRDTVYARATNNITSPYYFIAIHARSRVHCAGRVGGADRNTPGYIDPE